MQGHLNKVIKAYPQTKLFPIGLGDCDQELTLTISPGPLHACTTFTIPENKDSQCFINGKVWQQIKVPVRRLDHILQEQKCDRIPNLVKIDVEGYELEVLRGASSILGKTEVFILEVLLKPDVVTGSSMGEISSFMELYDYRLYDFADLGYHCENGNLLTLDAVFVRQNSKLWQ